MGWEKLPYADPRRAREWPAPVARRRPPDVDLRWVFGLALVGRPEPRPAPAGRHLPAGLATVAVGIAFVVVPEGRLWNGRLLPFYYLTTMLLAALAVAEVIRTIVDLVRDGRARARRCRRAGGARRRWPWWSCSWALPLGALPFGPSATDDRASPGPASARGSSTPSPPASSRRGPSGTTPATRARTPTASTTTWCTRMGELGEQRGLRAGVLGVREGARPLRHARWRSCCCRTGPTGASARWRASTSRRRPPRRSTSSPRSSCRPRRAPPSATCRTAPSTSPRASSTCRCWACGTTWRPPTRPSPPPAATPTSPRWRRRARGSSSRWPTARSWPPLDNEPAVVEGVDDSQIEWVEEPLDESGRFGGPAISWFNDPSQWDVPLARGGPDEWQRVDGRRAPRGACRSSDGRGLRRRGGRGEHLLRRRPGRAARCW